jgi:AbiV family abortive infection protein
LRNAADLLVEAELLLNHGHIARAFALAYTGWEEVGKAQLVGDYCDDMVSEEEFQAAFRDHNLKSAYNWRYFALDPKDIENSTIEYDRSRARIAFEKRQAAFYVEKNSDLKAIYPADIVSCQEAESAIRALKAEIAQIRKFDALNERIGSESFLK